MGASLRRKRGQRVRHSPRRAEIQHETRPETWAEKARRSTWLFWIEMAAAVVTTLGLLFAAYGLYQADVANRATLKEIEEASAQRIVELYNVAVDPKTVPAARKQTLEFLVERGQDLRRIDLSCATVGTFELDENGKKECIEGANLRDANMQEAHLRDANLEGANLRDVDLRRADLAFANLKGGYLRNANLQGANLEHANMQGAYLRGADFTDANLDKANFEGAWAWAFDPPINAPIGIDLCIFDEDIHKHWIKPDPCITNAP